MMELMTEYIIGIESVHYLCCVLEHLPEELDSEGEIASPEECSLRVSKEFLHFTQVIIPSGRPYDDSHIVLRIVSYILECCICYREVDHYVKIISEKIIQMRSCLWRYDD
jgi:hypothetical protein